jgi:hypothetical protein
MDTTTLLLAVLAATMLSVAVQAWRLGNERRDVALAGTVGAVLGGGALATFVL